MSDQLHAEVLYAAEARQRQDSGAVIGPLLQETERVGEDSLSAQVTSAPQKTLSANESAADNLPALVEGDGQDEMPQVKKAAALTYDNLAPELETVIAAESHREPATILKVENATGVETIPLSLLSTPPTTTEGSLSQSQTNQPRYDIASRAGPSTSSSPGPPVPDLIGCTAQSLSNGKPALQHSDGIRLSANYTQELGALVMDDGSPSDNADPESMVFDHVKQPQGNLYTSSTTPDVSAPQLDDAREDGEATELRDPAQSKDVLLLGAILHFRQKSPHGVAKILEHNAMLADSESHRQVPSFSSSTIRPLARATMRRHLAKQSALVARVQEQTAAVQVKAEGLKSEYKRLDALWRLDCRMLETADALRPPQVLFSGYPATAAPTPAPATPHVEDGTPARANRRRDTIGFSGDAARTEAEFEEIMGLLKDADMRDPNLRAAKTTAVVPDMGLGRRTEEDFEDQNGLVLDPITFYEAESNQAAKWTDDEREAFLKGYLQWPKQFGKVVKRLLPSKTASEAVLYYYRTKKEFDYKEALGAKGGQRRRRPGSGRRPGKASLMAGLARQQPSMLNPTEEATRPQEKVISGGLRSRDDSPVLSDSLDNDADTYSRSDATLEALSRQNAPQPKLNRGIEIASDVDSANEVALPVRKRKVSHNENAGDRPPRKKATTSSYWSTAEKMQVVRLLSSSQSPDFALIASSLENKSAQQVRNWYANHHADVAASNPTLSGNLSITGSTTTIEAQGTSSKHVGAQHSTVLPRTGLFQPMPNALHSLVSDSSVHERRASNALVGPEPARARGLNIAALLNEDASEAGDSEKHKRAVMGEWFGREEFRPRGSPEPAHLDGAGSDGTEDDVPGGV